MKRKNPQSRGAAGDSLNAVCGRCLVVDGCDFGILALRLLDCMVVSLFDDDLTRCDLAQCEIQEGGVIARSERDEPAVSLSELDSAF